MTYLFIDKKICLGGLTGTDSAVEPFILHLPLVLLFLFSNVTDFQKRTAFRRVKQTNTSQVRPSANSIAATRLRHARAHAPDHAKFCFILWIRSLQLPYTHSAALWTNDWIDFRGRVMKGCSAELQRMGQFTAMKREI